VVVVANTVDYLKSTSPSTHTTAIFDIDPPGQDPKIKSINVRIEDI